jgi:hypothetical protein
LLPTWKEALQILVTLGLAVLGWIIFRAETITQAWDYICGMMQFGTLRASYRFFLPNEYIVYPTNLYIIMMVVVEWLQRNKQHGLEVMNTSKYKWIRIAFYYVLVWMIIQNAGTEQTFIYFQF